MNTKNEIQFMTENGATIKEIQQKLNISYMKIWHTIRNNNFKFNTKKMWYDNNVIDSISNYLNEGKTYKEISQIFNKQDYHILSLAKKYNLHSKNDLPLTPDQKEKIKKYLDEGKTLKEIELLINKSDSTISYYLKQINLIPNLTQIKNLNKSLEMENKRLCPCCKKILFFSNFFGRICKECCRVNSRKNWILKKDNMTIDEIIQYKLKQTKIRAKRKKIYFNLTKEDIIELYNSQNGLCFYSGKKMSLKICDDDILSIDRIDSNMGYFKDNCVLCLFKINIMKNSLSNTDFINTCKNIIEFKQNFS